jgi:hypothetical protein
MNEFMNNMERKFGRYAIRNLTVYIIGIYIVGYILSLLPGGIAGYLALSPYHILQGQVWRIVSWVLIPPTALSFWIFITLYLYYFIGTTMERTIGTFRYNMFILGGFLFMIIAAFVSHAVSFIASGGSEMAIALTSAYIMQLSSTYYIQMMVFLMFAICYPDMQLLLFFIIPVKVKYLGIFYAGYLAFDAVYAGIINGIHPLLFIILFQFINLGLFYLSTGRLSHLRPREVKRRQEFHRNVRMTPPGVTRHKCAVCGRTEETNPELSFRFCSKCNGNYEYCQDHLFTHQHIQ